MKKAFTLLIILFVFQKLYASVFSVDTIKTSRRDSLKSTKDSTKFDINHFLDSLRQEVKLKRLDTLKFSGDLAKAGITKHISPINSTDSLLSHPNNNPATAM